MRGSSANRASGSKGGGSQMRGSSAGNAYENVDGDDDEDDDDDEGDEEEDEDDASRL